ncbi:MAG: hypothetical protein PVF17_00295 [Ignavibacteria bacterium]|jgi:hypothetical protein
MKHRNSTQSIDKLKVKVAIEVKKKDSDAFTKVDETKDLEIVVTEEIRALLIHRNEILKTLQKLQQEFYEVENKIIQEGNKQWQ